MTVSAPAAGTLTTWAGKEGTAISKSNAVGQISDGTKSVNVATPLDGTIIKNQAKPGQMVQPGQTLAQVVDMKNLYVTANINETDVKDLQVGASVDVTVDGDTSTLLKGKIDDIAMPQIRCFPCCLRTIPAETTLKLHKRCL